MVFVIYGWTLVLLLVCVEPCEAGTDLYSKQTSELLCKSGGAVDSKQQEDSRLTARTLCWTLLSAPPVSPSMGETLPRLPGGAQLHEDPPRRVVQTFRVKMVLLGSSGVGKSSLAVRFGKDEFRSASPTVGCAYLTCVVHLSDVTLRFEMWDTAGQEKYHSITPLYYRGAHAALLVYDISKRETFVRAQMWLKELEKQYIPGSTVIWLVGNKADLAETRQVSAEEGQALASDRGLYFTETSALSGDHVSELLLGVAHRVYECIGAQQGGLSEWKETPLVDIRHRKSFTPLASCCKVGP